MAFTPNHIPHHGIAGTITNAGQHSEGQRANRGRFNDVTEGIFRWVRKQLPSPGAQNYAFETLGLPEFSPYGAGIVPTRFFKILEGNVVFQNQPAVLTNGLGGLVTGNIYLSPLYDPSTNTFGGVPIQSGNAVSQEFPNSSTSGIPV